MEIASEEKFVEKLGDLKMLDNISFKPFRELLFQRKLENGGIHVTFRPSFFKYYLQTIIITVGLENIFGRPLSALQKYCFEYGGFSSSACYECLRTGRKKQKRCPTDYSRSLQPF